MGQGCFVPARQCRHGHHCRRHHRGRRRSGKFRHLPLGRASALRERHGGVDGHTPVPHPAGLRAAKPQPCRHPGQRQRWPPDAAFRHRHTDGHRHLAPYRHHCSVGAHRGFHRQPPEQHRAPLRRHWRHHPQRRDPHCRNRPRHLQSRRHHCLASGGSGIPRRHCLPSQRMGGDSLRHGIPLFWKPEPADYSFAATAPVGSHCVQPLVNSPCRPLLPGWQHRRHPVDGLRRLQHGGARLHPEHLHGDTPVQRPHRRLPAEPHARQPRHRMARGGRRLRDRLGSCRIRPRHDGSPFHDGQPYRLRRPRPQHGVRFLCPQPLL